MIIPSDAVHRPTARSHRPRRARPRDEHHDDRSRRPSPSDSPSRSFVALSRPLPPRARPPTVGARASTKSRDGDTSTGHDSSLSSIIIHQPSSIPPLSVDCIKITGRDPSRCPDRLASRVMSSSDRLDSTRLDSIDSTRSIDGRPRSTRGRTRRLHAVVRARGPGRESEALGARVRRVGRPSRRVGRRSSRRRVVASSRRRVVASSTSPVRSFARSRAGGTGRDGTGRDWRMTMDRATTSMRATSSTSATSGWRRRGGEEGGNGRGRDARRRGPRPRGRAMGARRKVRRSKDGGETRTRAPGGEEARREGGARRGDDARGRESERDASG